MFTFEWKVSLSLIQNLFYLLLLSQLLNTEYSFFFYSYLMVLFFRLHIFFSEILHMIFFVFVHLIQKKIIKISFKNSRQIIFNVQSLIMNFYFFVETNDFFCYWQFFYFIQLIKYEDFTQFISLKQSISKEYHINRMNC